MLTWKRPLALLVLCATLWSCGDDDAEDDEQRVTRSDSMVGMPRPTPAAQFTGSPDVVSRDSFLTYARTLQFDTSLHAMDVGFLARGSGASATIGAHAALAPEIGAVALDTNQLAGGRVIARYLLDRDFNDALHAGYTYVWFGRTDRWRICYVSENSRHRPVCRPAVIHPRMVEGLAPNVNLAKIQQAYTTNIQWECTRCVRYGWCEPDSLFGATSLRGGDRRQPPEPGI